MSGVTPKADARTLVPTVPSIVVLASLVIPLAAALEKGIIYVQPSYHYTNTLDLDLEVRRDAHNSAH